MQITTIVFLVSFVIAFGVFLPMTTARILAFPAEAFTTWRGLLGFNKAKAKAKALKEIARLEAGFQEYAKQIEPASIVAQECGHDILPAIMRHIEEQITEGLRQTQVYANAGESIWVLRNIKNEKTVWTKISDPNMAQLRKLREIKDVVDKYLGKAKLPDGIKIHVWYANQPKKVRGKTILVWGPLVWISNYRDTSVIAMQIAPDPEIPKPTPSASNPALPENPVNEGDSVGAAVALLAGSDPDMDEGHILD